MHVTHYDPAWCAAKEHEQPFDAQTAAAIIDAMAANHLNTLIVDCADGVIYRSHPELQRHYSAPMAVLEELCRRAERHAIEVVPKLNFSQSRFYRHNQWMYPHNENVNGRDIFETPEYWRIAFELTDELIAVCRPNRFFHIGMDEDHDRSHAQFAAAVNLLADGLQRRGLRAVMWRDSRLDARGLVFNEKHSAAEKLLPANVVRMVWNYEGVSDTETIRTMRNGGFEIWAGIAGAKPESAAAWDRMLAHPGNPHPGIIITNWKPCIPAYRATHLGMLNALAGINTK